MIIPNRILEMAKRAEAEIAIASKRYDLTSSGERSLEKIRDIRRQLRSGKGELFSSKDDYINAINIMEAIIQACEILFVPEARRVFVEIEVEQRLMDALYNAIVVSSKMRKEINAIIKFIKEDIPNSSWSQKDEYAYYKTFKLVKTKEEWNRIMNEYSGMDLGTGMDYLEDFEFVKIGYVQEERTIYTENRIIQEAKKHIIEKLGEEEFESRKEEFERWYKLGITGIYYIYVPN